MAPATGMLHSDITPQTPPISGIHDGLLFSGCTITTQTVKLFIAAIHRKSAPVRIGKIHRIAGVSILLEQSCSLAETRHVKIKAKSSRIQLRVENIPACPLETPWCAPLPLKGGSS